MKKFKNLQRPRRNYRFNIVGHKKAFKIWWDSPFNVPLILKVPEIIFSQAKQIIVLSVAKANFGVKKVKTPEKKSQEMPHYMFWPRQKRSSPGLSKSEVNWYFYVPKRKKEKEKEKEKERKKVWVIIFPSRRGQN